MAIEKVKEYLKQWNRDKDVVELQVSTATVILAAEALKVIPARIAKSITLRNNKGGGMLIVASGDIRVDNKKFKTQFGFPPKMLTADEALKATGFAVGGICPFALPDDLDIYLDESIKRFDSVFPACGSANSMIEVTIDELVEYSRSRGWVDIGKYVEIN